MGVLQNLLAATLNKSKGTGELNCNSILFNAIIYESRASACNQHGSDECALSRPFSGTPSLKSGGCPALTARLGSVRSQVTCSTATRG